MPTFPLFFTINVELLTVKVDNVVAPVTVRVPPTLKVFSPLRVTPELNVDAALTVIVFKVVRPTTSNTPCTDAFFRVVNPSTLNVSLTEVFIEFNDEVNNVPNTLTLLLKLALFKTVKLVMDALISVDSPVTPSAPVIFASPATSNFFVGALVPMPTLPLSVIRIFSVLESISAVALSTFVV